MKPQTVFRDLTDTMTGGLAPNETGFEYKDHSKIYNNSYKLQGMYANKIACNEVTDKNKFVFCYERNRSNLKTIGRKTNDHYDLVSVSEDFTLRNYRASGYTRGACLIYQLVGHSHRCYPFTEMNFRGMTAEQILKKCGYGPTKYRFKSIDMTIDDAYFSVDIKVNPDEPINIDPDISVTLRIFII